MFLAAIQNTTQKHRFSKFRKDVHCKKSGKRNFASANRWPQVRRHVYSCVSITSEKRTTTQVSLFCTWDALHPLQCFVFISYLGRFSRNKLRPNAVPTLQLPPASHKPSGNVVQSEETRLGLINKSEIKDISTQPLQSQSVQNDVSSVETHLPTNADVLSEGSSGYTCISPATTSGVDMLKTNVQATLLPIQPTTD